MPLAVKLLAWRLLEEFMNIESTLNGRGERNTIWQRCYFVTTALGSGIFESKFKQRHSLIELWPRENPQNDCNEGSLSHSHFFSLTHIFVPQRANLRVTVNPQETEVLRGPREKINLFRR